MKRASVRGFTIVELVLFLAVTGSLFVALMFGINANITQQRYKESVFNISTLIQDQYSEVDNTRNDRGSDWRCENSDISVDAVNGQSRGTSNCVLLGRALEVNNQGTVVRTMSVVGTEPAELTESSDLDAINSYNPRVSEFNRVDTEVDWQSKMLNTEGHTTPFSMVILRSPVSGLLKVFALSTPLPNNLSNMINPSATEAITLCIDGERGSLPVFSINVDPSVSSADGVTIKEFDQECQ